MRGTAHPRPGCDGLGSSRTSQCRSTAPCSHKASLAWYRTVKTLMAAAHLRSRGLCRAAGRRTSLAGAQRKILGEIQAIHLAAAVAVAMAVADDPSSRGSLHPCPASALSTKVESRRSFARSCEMRIQLEAATKPLSAVSNAGQVVRFRRPFGRSSVVCRQSGVPRDRHIRLVVRSNNQKRCELRRDQQCFLVAASEQLKVSSTTKPAELRSNHAAAVPL
jgi:hypothetical protein